MEKKRVLCFGDSNTYGFDPVTGGRYGPDHRWPSVLQRELGDSFEVISEGLNGRTTVFGTDEYRHINGYEYMIPCLLSHGPIDLLIIMLGTNDCGVVGITAREIARGAKALVNTALSLPVWPGKAPFEGSRPAFRVPILLAAPASLTLPEGGFGSESKYQRDSVRLSKDIVPLYKVAATRLGVAFFDANSAVSVCDFDHVHLTAESQATLGMAFAEQVRGLLL